MVFCPNCGLENNDSAKFCKNCGNPLKVNRPIKEDYVATGNDPTVRVNNSSFNSSNSKNNSKSDNKNLIIICLTIVICAILIAGALVLFSNNNSNNDSALSDSNSLNDSNAVDNSVNDYVNGSVNTESVPAESTTKTAKSDNMQILSGSFSTGSSASDKTYCSVYVGSQYAGESVKISVLYSYNGDTLNQGNIVPKTVSSDGYIEVPTAYALDYYPDDAYVTIYDSNGNVLDTQEVYLNPNSGKQTF